MKLSKLNIFRWILFFLSPSLLVSFIYLIEKGSYEEMMWGALIVMLWFFSTVALLVLFIIKRTTISRSIKIFLLALVPISLILYFLSQLITSKSDTYIEVTLFSIFVYSTILAYISYLEKAEIILFGLIIAIIISFTINRFGVSEGGFFIPFTFFLSSIGFIILAFKSFRVFKKDKSKGLIFVLYYFIVAILNALLLLKFLDDNPALNNIYDTIGVIIFLLACLALFIILPFINFTDWTNHLKLAFKRLIITPLILFLFIFSLKFLLPDKVYRNIFFIESLQKEQIHFNMEDYKIDFSRKQ